MCYNSIIHKKFTYYLQTEYGQIFRVLQIKNFFNLFLTMFLIILKTFQVNQYLKSIDIRVKKVCGNISVQKQNIFQISQIIFIENLDNIAYYLDSYQDTRRQIQYRSILNRTLIFEIFLHQYFHQYLKFYYENQILSFSNMLESHNIYSQSENRILSYFIQKPKKNQIFTFQIQRNLHKKKNGENIILSFIISYRFSIEILGIWSKMRIKFCQLQAYIFDRIKLELNFVIFISMYYKVCTDNLFLSFFYTVQYDVYNKRISV
ncbi:hypothetical protein pb186bvf_009263 [Paramecium bursaria]